MLIDCGEDWLGRADRLRPTAMRNRSVVLYVGDGAVLARSLVRTRGSALLGHASVAQQLNWCRAGGVASALFTHCGSGIVRSTPGRMEAMVSSFGPAQGVKAGVANDGLVIRPNGRPRSAGKPTIGDDFPHRPSNWISPVRFRTDRLSTRRYRGGFSPGARLKTPARLLLKGVRYGQERCHTAQGGDDFRRT